MLSQSFVQSLNSLILIVSLTLTLYLYLSLSMINALNFNDVSLTFFVIFRSSYADALREVSAAREEVPGRRGFPGYMYAAYRFLCLSPNSNSFALLFQVHGSVDNLRTCRTRGRTRRIHHADSHSDHAQRWHHASHSRSHGKSFRIVKLSPNHSFFIDIYLHWLMFIDNDLCISSTPNLYLYLCLYNYIDVFLFISICIYLGSCFSICIESIICFYIAMIEIIYI